MRQTDLSRLDPAGGYHAQLAWKPKAKDRPRTTISNGRYHTYNSRETVAAEQNLAYQWSLPITDQLIAVSLDLTDTQVGVTVVPCPAPASRLLRGDLDNYAKLILDALNGVAWVDDRQIIGLNVRKL